MRIHVCVLDLDCWKQHREFGMPMRVHVGKRFWTIPGLSGDRISERVWANAKPVRMVRRCSVQGCPMNDENGPVTWRWVTIDYGLREGHPKMGGIEEDLGHVSALVCPEHAANAQQLIPKLHELSTWKSAPPTGPPAAPA